ncbi:Uncharacterised protein [Bordetella pertussis]|nr:Uncharacterised protein [Bordetella pertussis]
MRKLIVRGIGLHEIAGRRILRRAVAACRARPEQQPDQGDRRILCSAPRGLSLRESCPGSQGCQMRQRDLVADLGAMYVGQQVQRARLDHGPAVGGGIRRPQQLRPCAGALAQPVQGQPRHAGQRHERQAQRQCLARLARDGRASRPHLAPWALPVNDLSERARVCEAARPAADCAARACALPSSPASSRAMAAV